MCIYHGSVWQPDNEDNCYLLICIWVGLPMAMNNINKNKNHKKKKTSVLSKKQRRGATIEKGQHNN